MKKIITALSLVAALVGFAATPDVIIISPNELVNAWQGYANDRTTAVYEVINANDIYVAYPYTTGEKGKPRNPAESIHAFIRAKAAEGVSYFMLGGAWFDAQDLDRKVYFQGADTVIGLDNAIPGVYANIIREDEDKSVATIPSDLYFACHENIPENGYQWDAEGDGVYLNDVTYTDGVTNYDLTPDVVVSRVALKSATGINGYWISLNGGSTDLVQMVANYSAKVKRLEDGSFEGYNNYSIIAGAVTGDAATERNGLAALKREEFSFYDGLPNFFDADHTKVGNETTELIARRRIRDQIAPYRPIEKVDVISAGTWSRDHESMSAALDSYKNTDHAFDMMYSHGLVYESVWMMAVGANYLTPGVYGTNKGLTAFANYAGPCCGSTPDLSFVRDEKTYSDVSITDAMLLNPIGGAVAAVGNTRGGWYDKSFTLSFDRDMSWILANRMLVGFVQEGKNAGETWKQAVSSYVTDAKVTNSTHLWLLIEDMLSGDPLVKLTAAQPEVENIGIETNTAQLTIDSGNGYGGNGVVFTTASRGKLTLAGDNQFYLGGLENADLELTGNNKIIDFDNCKFEPSFTALTLATGTTNNVIRSQSQGAFSKIKNNLYIRGGTSLILATYDAFNGLKEGELSIASGGELIIAANPYRSESPRRGESLNVKMSTTSRGTVRVAKGGYFTPVQNLAARVKYVVDAYDGIGGNITVPSGASLELKQLPLTGVTGFAVQSGATLKLPSDSQLTDLLDCDCVATISKDAYVYFGDTPLTLTTDQSIDGKAYVGAKVVYLMAGSTWNANNVPLVNKYGEDTTYTGEEKIVIKDSVYPEMWISSQFDNATFEIDGGSVQVENEGNSKTTFSGALVTLVNGAKLNFRDRWNGVKIVNTIINVNDGCIIGEDLSYPMRKSIDVSGEVKILGNMTDVDFPHGIKIVSKDSVLTTSLMKDDSLVVTSGVEGYKVASERLEDRIVYTLVDDPEYIRATAFGKTWKYVYHGGTSIVENGNWGTVANGRFVAMDKAPLLTNSGLFENALFNGEYIDVALGDDGKKHVGSKDGDTSVEGWNIRVGLTNNVVVTFNDLAKFQGSEKYIYVDETSQLIIKKMTATGNCNGSVDLHVAAENGIVFENGMKNGVACNYYLGENGSVSFTTGVAYNTHTIKAVEIELGEGDGKAIKSRKLISLGGSSTGATFELDSNATITTDDPEVTGAVKATDVTTSDPVGTCSLRKEDDGVYLDYVGRKEVAPAIATVVRAHPRLTRGLDKEALLGIRFDNSYGGAPSEITLRFDFVNCTTGAVSNVQLWRMPFDPLPAAFYETKAKLLCAAETAEATEQKLRVTFASTEHIYPCVNSRAESDYLWVTASIDENIPIDAEIYVSVENETISLGASVYTVKNGAAVSPHRVFPYYYQIGAYFRSDRVSANSCAPLENATEERVKNLTDLILINNMWVGHADDGSLYANWPEGESAKVAYMKSLRDRYNPKAMVRLGLTKGSNMDDIGDKTKRAQLVESIVAIMSETGVDGLDVDWEYPENANQWRCYGLLLRDLAAEFFDRGWVLSICTNLGYRMPDNNYHTVFHAADYIDSMAYGGKPINASPGVMKTGIAVCTQRGVPSRRIVVGQAMYAYENGNPGWGSVVRWIKSQYGDDRSRWWDADYVLKDGTTKETYEGPSSYQAKCNWCRANGYGGVMSWGYYTDTDWNNDDLMSLARHQAKSCWPVENKTWPTPPQDTDGYYLLDSEEDWFWLRDNQGANVRFVADITLDHDPLPIEQRTGVLDGAGHKLIIPKDTWLCYEDNPALIRQLDGTIKNLTIDLYGRVVSRASRWNDTECTEAENKLSTPYADHCAAVLACKARWGAKVENVTVIIRKGAEVQGPVRTAGLIADVFVSGGNTVSITNSKVIVEGDIHSIARNTAESDISVSGSAVGALAANADLGGASSVTIRNCSVDSVREIALFGNKGAAVTTEGTAFTSDGDALAAYLLNCELETIADKKAKFKFTAEDLEKLMRGEKLETINGVEFNGTLTIVETEVNGGKLYRAKLEL